MSKSLQKYNQCDHTGPCNPEECTIQALITLFMEEPIQLDKDVLEVRIRNLVGGLLDHYI